MAGFEPAHGASSRHSWLDLDSLRGFAGDHWHRAVIHPDEKHLIEEASVCHYYDRRIS